MKELNYDGYKGIIKNINKIWYIENIEPCVFHSINSHELGLAIEYWKHEIDYRRKEKFQ